MGQILLEDKISTLTHSAGVISLAPSRLTVGGQQYEVTTLNRTISTDVVLAANTLYMVYAVISGGVVSLKISTNYNSVGPSGFTVWKLVGAFITGWQGSFGQFLEIDTLKPQLRMAYSRSTFTPVSTASVIVTGWSTDGLYFDNTNGLLRVPLSGLWRFGISAYHNGNPGTLPANSIVSNFVLALGFKSTAPSAYNDLTNGTNTNNPITGGNIPTHTSFQITPFNCVAGHYGWAYLQSNDFTRGLVIAYISAELESLSAKIQDM